MGDSSILAPSVQELAKQAISKVPEQYLQPNQELPIINFDKLLCEDAIKLESLDNACKEWGYF